jgi:hypothetical protein
MPKILYIYCYYYHRILSTSQSNFAIMTKSYGNHNNKYIKKFGHNTITKIHFESVFFTMSYNIYIYLKLIKIYLNFICKNTHTSIAKYIIIYFFGQTDVKEFSKV